MRSLPLAIGLCLIASAASADGPAAEEVIARLTDGSADAAAWFEANAKDRLVTWVAPAFNVQDAGVVIVSGKVSDRGLFGCVLPDHMAAAAESVSTGEPVLCSGRIEDFETLGGAAIVNIAAEEIIVGADKIDARLKAAKTP